MFIELSEENIKGLVRFCEGDESLIEQWMSLMKHIDLKTIDELIENPFKKKMNDLCELETQSSIINDFVCNLELERHQFIDLECLLEIVESELEGEELEKIYSEIVRIRFGGVVIDW